MTKRIYLFTSLLLFSLLLWSCKDNSTGSGNAEAPSQKQFVWESLNYWYFWQADVPKLADNQAFFDDNQDYQDYLINFQDSRSLFNDLLFTPENFGSAIGEDDFSFFIDDYVAFQESRQGISEDFGFEYGLVRFAENSSNLFGYVQYVLEDTPADEAGLERGDIFTGINGSALTLNNYRSLLSSSPIELNLAESVNGDISATGESITVNSTQITENPIFMTRVIETDAAKVGYLLYNSFQANSHRNLNDAFGNFLAEGIDELVLDLRYNGGGSVLTSAILSSLISGLDNSNVFGVFTHNAKRSSENGRINFYEDVLIVDENFNVTERLDRNSLSIDKLYVLTGFGTASASEAVINGLNPFMDVILIGRQTVGKDDASITLYDAPPPYTDRSQANPNHLNAIQPIILKIRNDIGESNGTGFIPNYPVNEIRFLDDLPPLGDENDPLLAQALELITGEPVAKEPAFTLPFSGEFFRDSRDLEQFGKDMYIFPEQLKNSGLTRDHSK